MKVKNNRNSSLLLILVVAILFFALLYKSYQSYNIYQEKSYRVDYLILINRIDRILFDIEKERSYSAIYMGTNHKKDLLKLEEYRVLVDHDLEDIFELFKIDEKMAFQEATIKKIYSQLIYTRNRVDVLNMDYHNILFDNYVNKVVMPFINIVKYLSHEGLIPNLYYEVLMAQENLYGEKNFISFILSGQKEMNNQDLLFWENFLKKDSFYISDMVSSSKLLEKMRGEIFLDSLSGKYKTSLKSWRLAQSQKNTLFKKRGKEILLKEKKNMDSELSALKYQMGQYILASLAILIILIMLYSLYRKNVKNSRLLIDTLSDLESDLDEHQREEIKKVLKENDTLAIYRFLVNAIKEPSRAKDHFLANMSHEIRTPLNGIIGFTNILKETDLEEDQQEFLSIIEESSNNLITIVNDILDFSKVASGKVEIENIAFNIMDKFEASIDSYAAKAAQKDIDLNLLIDPNLPTELIGDPTKISQVIINLLSNAVKFTDEGGRVDIIIEQLKELDNRVSLKFSIKDSGIGMTPEQQGKVFDAFSQADVSTSRQFGGTGLGLTISKKFISLMGGNLDLESELGEGTTFFFILELEKSKDSTKRESPDFSHLNVVYVSMIHKKPKIDILKTYVDYTGANFYAQDYNEILALTSHELPHLLFIDHHYIEDEEILESLCQLDTKTILISTSEVEKCDCEFKNKISKILYQPVNFSKTIRALNLTKIEKKISSIQIEDKSSVKEINTISSAMVFNNMSALVVEDNIINQKLLKSILSNFDINITLAPNGLEGFKLRKKNEYDIIFMDIQMPVMDGVESTQKIIEYEKDNNLKHVPIVALTANTWEKDKEKYFKAGMDKYLKKPVDISELTTILEEYFPLKEIRNSIPIDSHILEKTIVAPKIILYKETDLTAKIYTAILKNLGYSVDVYKTTDDFVENLEENSYKFALFDSAPFKRIHSENFIVELIKDSGATPIAFVEKSSENDHCETLDYVGDANRISETLEKCG